MRFARRLGDGDMHDGAFGLVRRSAIEVGDRAGDLRLSLMLGSERRFALAAAAIASSAAPPTPPSAALAIAIRLAGRLGDGRAVARLVQFAKRGVVILAGGCAEIGGLIFLC